MSQQTVTVDGVEFDKEELAEAIEAFGEKDIVNGSGEGVFGDRYAIYDDGDDDSYVNIVDTSVPKVVLDGGGTDFFELQDLRDAVEEADAEYVGYKSSWIKRVRSGADVQIIRNESNFAVLYDEDAAHPDETSVQTIDGDTFDGVETDKDYYWYFNEVVDPDEHDDGDFMLA